MLFLDGERELEPTKLKLEWRQINGEYLPVVTTADGTKTKTFDAFSEEDALRLALWVARSEISIPFSAPPTGHPAREMLAKRGYTPPTHGFTCLSVPFFEPARMEESRFASRFQLAGPILLGQTNQSLQDPRGFDATRGHATE